MRTRLFELLFLLCAVLLAGSCAREEFQNPGSGSDGDLVDCVISFGSPKGATIDVDTKAELGIVRESNVFNIYLLIFEGNASSSKKIYGHYFDGNNLNATLESNYWTVTNMSDANSDPTSGTLHIKTASKAGCTIVAVANMNPNDLDVSAGLLSTIQTFGELQNVVATQVRSEIAANSGFFLMTGQVDGVNIQGNTADANDISKKSLTLKRLYAKVTFNVRVARNPDQSNPETKNNSLLRDFVPYTWQVVNVPTCSYLLPRAEDAADTPSELFSTEELGFETETLTPNKTTDFYNDGVTPVSIHSFSFYMMENRHAPASGISTYADRERREKPVSYTQGTFFDNGEYVYTDPLSAYVVLTGKIVMGVSASGNDNATLDANVRYEIHLGNFTDDVTDFNTNRNYNYVYNIFIGGAEDIKAEVEAFRTGELTEPEPGATGRVVVALEEVFDSDCHYSTQVISFHANYMDSENISWYVETPFNPDGVGGTDVAEGRAILSQIDYKWVEFFVNEKDASGSYYSDRRTIYKPHDYDFRDINGDAIPPGDKRRTMYVNELVDYLKGQKEQYDIDQRKADPLDPSYDPDWTPKNDFDTDEGTDGPKISVTAFIDEYYYTKHPITGQYDPTLWKEIVNHPMRRMHILASSATSADRESSLIGSSFTIQQRSIQSIYAVHEVAGLQSAWGMEFTDDGRETGLSTYWKTKETPVEDCGNTSSTNGRLNSLKIWGIINPDGTEKPTRMRWDEFLNLNGTNQTAHLWRTADEGSNGRDYDYLRYSCLSRNRDNNGDGYIDADEIRWYMASDVQLIGVFLGSYGIEGDARLYQRSASDQAESNKDKWRQHIVASNRFIYPVGNPSDWNNSNRYPRIVWAEEGVNGSNYNYSGTDQTTKFSTRCVRNLGYYLEGGQRKDITLAEDPEVEPNPFIIVTRKNLDTSGEFTGDYDDKTYYEFDCSRINRASLREPVDHQLIGHDEHSKMACLSSGFVTLPATNTSSLSSYTAYSFNNSTYNLTKVNELNKYLDDSFPNLDANLSVCPEGYRLPNVREMSIMWTTLAPMETNDGTYLGKDDNNAVPCRTHWSFGVEGSKKMNNKWGWGMSKGHLLMADNNKTMPTIRCVKDI